MKINSIIVTHNAARWIDRCFGSLLSSDLSVKICAIDNASIDNTPAIIRNKYPQTELLEMGENLGFGRANNVGLTRALNDGADYVFLLNQDAWVEAATIRLLAECMSRTGFDILSPLQYTGKGDALDRYFALYLGPTAVPEFNTDYSAKSLRETYEVKFVNAAAWLISRKCLLTLGGFAPVFRHYGEDRDYVNRLHFHGLRMGVLTNARIFHDRPQISMMDRSVRRYTRQLVILSDVNRTFMSAIIRSMTGAMRHFSSCLLRFDIPSFLRYAGLLNRLLLTLLKIQRCRAIARRPGICFLNNSEHPTRTKGQ